MIVVIRRIVVGQICGHRVKPKKMANGLFNVSFVTGRPCWSISSNGPPTRAAAAAVGASTLGMVAQASMNIAAVASPSPERMTRRELALHPITSFRGAPDEL